jgi:hypothetical protein
VPAFGPLCLLPGWFDYLLLVILAWALVRFLQRPSAPSPSWLALFALAALMACDQLRWQPWAYHLLILGAVLRLAEPGLAVRLLRWLSVSIYFYAGVSKLDNAFGTTIGRQMIDALFALLGIQASGLSDNTLVGLALAMPLVEASLAPLLFFRKIRPLGVGLAIAMHLLAVLALGPLGLGHRPGVLLWNVVFAAQTWLLFASINDEEAPAVFRRFSAMSPRNRAATILAALVILAPLTRPAGWWDCWPSWGLYSPGGEQTDLYVRHTFVDRLPASLPLDKSTSDQPWQRLRLDQWMLDEAYAPLYPQRRTTLALALGLHKQAQLSDSLRVVLKSPANRFTGERTTKTLAGADEVRDYMQRYWLNTTTTP